jgi:acetyl esterase/lipase
MHAFFRFAATALIGVSCAIATVPGQEASSIQWIKDRTFSETTGQTLQLDLALPSEPPAGGRFPAVLYFHGGGWQSGRRQEVHEQIQLLATKGFVGIAVSYRLAPDHKWPAQIHDAKTAVRFVRTHAAEFNIDPDRIAAAGESAGGHLALMLGLTGPDDDLEGAGEWSDVSSRVQSVVSYSALVDFTKLKFNRPPEELTPEETRRQAASDAHHQTQHGKTTAEVLAEWTGTADPADPIWKDVSPVQYVSRGDAPVLIIQGDGDPVVPVEQGRLLNRMLTAAAVRHDLLIIEGAGSSLTQAQATRATTRMVEFLRLTLPAPR